MAIQVSPGIAVSEVDLTPSTPAVSTSVAGIAGIFNWGPVLFVTPISSETQLNTVFGDPDTNTATSYLSAANFLAYADALQVVRASGTGQKNACSNGVGVLINNENVYFNNQYTTTAANNAYVARYPGYKGSSIQVVTFANGAAWTANSTNTSDPLYSYANYFSWAPNTTPYVSQVTNGAVTKDEMHVLVIDQDGWFTGQANTVLEKYQGLSKLSDALNPSGASNYYKEVLWQNSKYVYNTGHPTTNSLGWGTQTLSLPTFGADANTNVSSLSGGVDGTFVDANTQTAIDQFDDKQHQISLFITGAVSNVVQSYAINSLATVRKDLVVFCSPSLAATQDPTSPAAAIVTYVNTVSRSSFAVFDSGWKYQYDKYNDVYRWIPLNADIAGLCAYTDSIKSGPWWSPAGLQRGQIKNSVRLAYNPVHADRDTLYNAGVNPVVTFPGEGTMLYGDKTFLNYSSAFDHINVRRLFIYLEQVITKASRTTLFEFNDAFTRSQFINLVTPFLRQVMGGRGIQAFKVVCDTTNNTPAVINGNQFVGDIYIQPNYSINYIQLNFIATPTGVSFNQVIGQF